MLFATPSLDEVESGVVARVEELRRQLRFQLTEPRRWFGSLRRLSLARAIQASNTIEGFTAPLDDVAAAALGEEPIDADDETRLALRGYREAMTYVLQLAREPGFEYSDQLLKSLQFMMTSYDLAKRPGLWRAGPIYVRNDETDDIVYEGPDVELVQGLVDELVGELNAPGSVPGLVRAGMAHLNLVMIHPFRDGNGRMARCLQTLVLGREGVLAPEFCSVEEYLGRNTDDYYAVLAQVGSGRWQPERDARPWVRFILTAHLRQAQTLLRRVRESEELWGELERIASTKKLPERTISVLFDAAQNLRIRNATYRAIWPDEVSEQTASRDLRLLVSEGLLRPIGEKRGRYYVGSEDLREMWRRIRAKRTAQDEVDPFGAA